MSEKIPLTPKAKAKELIEKFNDLASDIFDHDYDKEKYLQNRKSCALIVWNEIVDELIDYGEESDELQNMDLTLRWWSDVKIEIENYHE
ncbi:MAG: hypothetical protein PHT07_23830 [Paludibacter sp.]|nr:hypothetical protein [Paludibacter sp.]